MLEMHLEGDYGSTVAFKLRGFPALPARQVTVKVLPLLPNHECHHTVLKLSARVIVMALTQFVDSEQAGSRPQHDRG